MVIGGYFCVDGVSNLGLYDFPLVRTDAVVLDCSGSCSVFRWYVQ
jgi:hypothetical protein